MLKLQEVLDFIKNADQLEIAQITRVASIRKSEVNYDVKSSFRVEIFSIIKKLILKEISELLRLIIRISRFKLVMLPMVE